MWKPLLVICLAFSLPVAAQVKVLALSGSTRQDSYNQKLVTEAAQIASQMGAAVTVINLRDYPLPFFDEDVEAKEGIPAKGKELRQLMAQSQLIIIASPEYNASLSAVLKNTIDWASRDDAQGNPSPAFKGKKFLIMSASPGGGGGKRGIVHLRAILTGIGGNVLPNELTVPNAFNAFDAQGHLKDPAMKQQLQKLVQSALQ